MSSQLFTSLSHGRAGRWALLALTLLFSGCGASRAINPISPSPVEAAAPPFPAQQALTCAGDYLSTSGMICDESDGATYYHHYHWSVTIRPDHHGTFQVSTETGIRKTGLYQLVVPFPEIVNLVELHPTLSVNSYCSGNGFESKWDGLGQVEMEHLIGSKAYRFDASGISQDFPLSQIVYPQAVPVRKLQMYVYADLCSMSTVHWTVTGSF